MRPAAANHAMNHRVQEMNSIKIVIWDLDETFWKGTLSEGGIEPIPRNVDIVGQLSRRGIINSIASKNDYGEARAALERLGVWEDFVFPEIRWEAKGPLVRRILSNCRLRARRSISARTSISATGSNELSEGG